MNILKSLRSPFQMDIYAWLSLRSLRTLRLNRPEPVSWEVLKQMFGSDYAEVRQFRSNFLQASKKSRRSTPNCESRPATMLCCSSPFPRACSGVDAQLSRLQNRELSSSTDLLGRIAEVRRRVGAR